MVQSSDHMFNQSSIQMVNDGTPDRNNRFTGGLEDAGPALNLGQGSSNK